MKDTRWVSLAVAMGASLLVYLMVAPHLALWQTLIVVAVTSYTTADVVERVSGR